MIVENEVFTPQLFTPGSDIAIGFRPSQIIWGRTGNDVLLGYQSSASEYAQPQIDILIGDFALEDPAFRQWNDTFILGDWVKPYYTNQSNELLSNLELFNLDFTFDSFDLNQVISSLFDSLDATDFAIIPDFNPELDTVQLYGEASDYQLLEVELGTIIVFAGENEPNPVGFLLGNTELDLTDSYFQFRGFTPPPGPTLSQIQQFGTSEYDIPLSISTDPDGNVYVAGGTNGSLVEANEGLRDNFVIKYSDRGEVLFALQFGTEDFETIYGIDTDNHGNFYITGVTGGNLFGSLQAEELDTFVAKYDSDGHLIWGNQIGQNVVFNAFNLAVDKETGDVFISGADVQPTLEDDTFIIKFDTDGNQQWMTETGIPGFLSFDESYGLTVAEDGSVYATGWTSGSLDGSNAGLYDNWLAKYDNATGDIQSITQYGTSDYEWSWGIQTDSAENVYTAGWTLGDLGSANAGSFDAYLNKFDDQGNLLWTEQFGTAEDDEAFDLYIDKHDNIFVAGYTNGNLAGKNAGSFDVWVAKYNQDGDRLWINQFGTSDRDELYSIVVDDAGYLYATGVTQGSLGMLNNGLFDGWVAKLDVDSGDLLSFDSEDESERIDLNDFEGEAADDVTVSQDANTQNTLLFDQTDAEDGIDDLLLSGEKYETVIRDSLMDAVESFIANNKTYLDQGFVLEKEMYCEPVLAVQENLNTLISMSDGAMDLEPIQYGSHINGYEDSVNVSDIISMLNSIEAITV